MLYITTRNNTVTYNAQCTLNQDSAEDRSLYRPQELPLFGKKEILLLQEKSFGENVSEILNLFFSTDLTGWDVDFSIGRSTARTAPLSNKVLLVELWHNPAGELDYIVSKLFNTVCKNPATETPSEWFRICIRIAMLFAVYGELKKQNAVSGLSTVDVAVSGKELAAPIAALYAKKMGLPIGTIVITNDQEKTLWKLIHRGELYHSQQAAALSAGIERILYETLGPQSVYDLLEANRQGRGYFLDEEILSLLNAGIFCVVSGADRSKQTINSIYRTSNYILDPNSAMCVGGLQDYRAKTGEHKQTIVLSEHSPRLYLDNIADATGLAKQKITELVNLL